MRSLNAALFLPLLPLAIAYGCGGDEHVATPKFEDPDASEHEPDSGPEVEPEAPTVVPGSKERFVLHGTIVTPDTIVEGIVLVEGANITCVGTEDECGGELGAEGATIVYTKGIIAPGLIDTHNHILFDIFDNDDWVPEKVYTNHNDWTLEKRYQAMLDVKQCLVNDSQGKPTWCTSTPYGTAAGSLRCEVDKFGELKGLIAGTTSIVGLPGTSSQCFSSVARSIDLAQNGIDAPDKIQTSALFPPAKSALDGVCANFADMSTDAYLIHVGEGTDAPSLAEFDKFLSIATDPLCIASPKTTITHGTAFTQQQFATMGQAGMKLTWSPQSNVSLYQATTNIPLALDANVTVALGPDWSMGGSQNMLDELRFAKKYSDDNWSARLSAKDIVTMATTNGAAAIGLGDKIGSIKKGMLADLVVIAKDRKKPYEGILEARPKDVRLVMIGGTIAYGDRVLEEAAPTEPGCEKIDICGVDKFLCVALATSENKLDQTYATIQQALTQALQSADSLTPEDGWNFAPLPPLVKCD